MATAYTSYTHLGSAVYGTGCHFLKKKPGLWIPMGYMYLSKWQNMS
jgi:hypothetical protein